MSQLDVDMFNVKFKILPFFKELDLNRIKNSIHSGKIIVPKIKIPKNELVLVKRGSILFSEDEKCDDVIEINKEIDELIIDKTYLISSHSKTITKKNSSNDYIAEVSGIFYVFNGKAILSPVSKDAFWEIIVSEDKLTIVLNLYPGIGEFGRPDFNSIVEAVERKNVKSSIFIEIIRNAIDKMVSTRQPVLDVEISRGKTPIDGIDAEVKFLVDIETDFKPKMTEDGRVDFYHLNTMNPVEENQEIAIFSVHKDGVDGEDVYGTKILAKKAKPLYYPGGRNTYQDKDKPDLIRAAISGNLVFKDGTITIDDVYKINGNVDFSTGNIESKGSLEVMGNVKRGFEINVENNVEIKGHIEDCKLKIGGDISIKSGFYGDGSGVIEANGKVDIKYVHNQKIYSRDSINVTHEVIDSELYALNKIQIVGGRNMAVYGGKLIAGEYIEANCIGNEYNVNTIVEAGYDYQYLEKYSANSKEIIEQGNSLLELEREINKLKNYMGLKLEHLKTFNLLVEQKGNIIQKTIDLKEQEEQLNKIDTILKNIIVQSQLNKINRDELVQQLIDYFNLMHSSGKLKNQNKELHNLIYEPSNAKIKINKFVYPGVVLMINKRKFNIEEKLTNKTFFLSTDIDEIVFM